MISAVFTFASTKSLRTLPWLALKGLLVSIEVRLSTISAVFTLLLIKVSCSLNLVVTLVPSTTTDFALMSVVSRPVLSTFKITLPELSAITTSPEPSSVMLGLFSRSL